MPRNNPTSPLDSQIDAYRNVRSPDDVLSLDFRHWVEECVVVGTEVYEMLEKRHRLSDGLHSLRQRSEIEAEEAIRRIREWLVATHQVVLPSVEEIEDHLKFNSVANSEHLRTYTNRAEGLLKEWDGTTTQSNVCWRDTELSDEAGEVFAELVQSGKAKAKFKRPALSPPK